MAYRLQEPPFAFLHTWSYLLYSLYSSLGFIHYLMLLSFSPLSTGTAFLQLSMPSISPASPDMIEI